MLRRDERNLHHGDDYPTRRRFLKTASATVGAAAGQSAFTILRAKAKGANDRIGMGFIGAGFRANNHLTTVGRMKDAVEIVAVCDIYGPRLKAAAEKTGARPYTHFQELLDDPRVDAVCIATPDRHHAPQAIESVRRGKDVYVEKPLTHWSQFELAKQLADEVRKHDRIVQVGTQFAIDDALPKIRERIKQGAVGKIVHVQAGCFRRGDWGERMPIPDPAAQPGPDLDWKQFLGDAPETAFSIPRFFQWRMFWDYAGGPATDLLFHSLAPIFQVLDLGFPQRVMCGGGTLQYDREVPDQCDILIDYEGGPTLSVTSSLSNFTGVDTMLRGTDGIVIWQGIDNPRQKGARIVSTRKDAQEELLPWTSMGVDRKLWEDFIRCVKTRQQPVSPVDFAVRVQLPLSMAIVSHRKSVVAKYDAASKTIIA
jgi:predicted dehydrogenase